VLAISLEFTPERDAEVFAAAPAAAAVFALRGESGEAYVSKSANLRRRLIRLLSAPAEHSKRLNLRARVRTIEYTPTGSDFESGLLLYKVLRAAFPDTYAKRLRLRPAPLLKLHLENQYPRASVTTRLGSMRGKPLYYGPFPSRVAAEKFANDVLDLFKMRRCVEELNPDPAFPGCIYSEMKMCLAPCFKGCTDDEYRSEVGRVQAFFDSGGQSLVRELTAQRDEASSALQFEQAAAIHSRIEKVTTVVAQLPELVRRLDRLAGVMIQPSATPDAVALFRIEGGRLAPAILFAVNAPPQAGKVQSMEARIQAALAAVPPLGPGRALETSEHLAILKRWYYRTSKVGEIFFADDKGELPMRRVVRGVSRVFRGEKAAGEDFRFPISDF
jgi:excinuclease UvrABC nuclease subunit